MQPFTVNVPESDIQDLRRRIAATRWPAVLPGTGWQRGPDLDYLRELAAYWRDGFDWRAAEARLNAHPQFVTRIDGQTVHFLHVRSPEPAATPLLLTHGWPGSVVEFLDVIGPLTDPAAHGGDPADAFHLVVPSLPGHGFSGPTTEPGWDLGRITAAWAGLMRELGHGAYVAAGGDWGSFVSLGLGAYDPEHVLGAHVTMLLTLPSGDPAELAALTPADGARLGMLSRFDQEFSGYLRLQSTRPQTVAYGLSDSPVGQLAWITEKFHDWNSTAAVPEDVVSRDALLANVSVYWFTNTAASSAALYYESAGTLAAAFTPGSPPPPVRVPVGVGVFGADLVPPVRSLAERVLPTISHWSEFDRGGHFAAMEQPELYVGDLRAFARTLRRVPAG